MKYEVYGFGRKFTQEEIKHFLKRMEVRNIRQAIREGYLKKVYQRKKFRRVYR